MKTIIIVTAYGEDNFYQKRYEDIVGLYSDVKKAIAGARADGMTTKQFRYLDRLNAFSLLERAIETHNNHEAFQVDYEEETNKRCKPCVSSYMFKVYNVI